MIVVSGVLADAMTELMCARLRDLAYEYVFFDQAQFPGRYGCTWEVGGEGVRGCLSGPDWKVDLASLTGVYARYVSYRGGPERPGLSEQERTLSDAEHQGALMQLFDLLPCTVVNRARASTSNDSKIWQAFLAERFGLLTPRTLATSDPDDARAFYEACERRVIYKSLSGVRSIVRRLTDDDLGERLRRVRNCPTQFQECVEGVDLRVHTVGDRTFATEIASDADDYRYAGRDGKSLETREVEIPPAIAEACVGMARALGLVLAGIDLRRTPDDRYYCFEINPSPGFLFYERATGQPISEAVANVLRANPATLAAQGRDARDRAVALGWKEGE